MRAKVENIVNEAMGVRSFQLSTEKRLIYLPGQWMTVRIKDEKRDFSISASPTEKLIQFTTKYSDSIFKSDLWQMRLGDQMEISKASGTFVLNKRDTQPKLFLAGGIGITPLRSMIKFVVDNKLPQIITLIYSAKTPEDLIFRPEFEQISQVKICLTITGKVGNNWNGGRGRINEQTIDKYCPDWRTRSWWICGAPAMVDGLMGISRTMGVEAKNVHSEEFSGY